MKSSEFYNVFDTNMVQVNKRTGICRKSLSQLPNEEKIGVKKSTAEIVLLHLDERTDNLYKADVQKSKQDIICALKNLKNAWNKYLKRQEVLNRYYVNYKLMRGDKQMIQPVKIKEVIFYVLQELKNDI